MNTFLFIVPLTPVGRLTSLRRRLQDLCLNGLKNQTYPGWQAILIGEEMPQCARSDARFIHLCHEAPKEEKLQHATEFIREGPLTFDYLLRLDDDDVVNPELLQKLAQARFNIFVDAYHSYWRPELNQFAQKVRYWFPNTFVISRNIAFTEFGEYPPGEHKNMDRLPMLIENEHNSIHRYFLEKKVPVVFSKRKFPVYLRSVSSSSITSNDANDTSRYFEEFGSWGNKLPGNFLHLQKFSFPEPSVNGAIKRLTELIGNMRALGVYRNKFKLESI